MKKRVLIANDASWISSGYGVYGKELLSRLHNSGKYEVAEIGCYASEIDPRIQSIPWKFYPNVPNNQDEKQMSLYKSQPINQFGSWRFNRCLLDFKPHIVFDIRDYWMFAYQEYSPYRRFFNWVIMPTVDSAPQNLEWYYTFANADFIIPYTDWAKTVLTKGGNNTLNIFPKIANAGINPNEFFPVPDKAAHKKAILGRSDLDVIGCVMRNQKRKLFPDIMYVFRKYLDSIKGTDKYDKTILYLHTSYPEENGWKLPELLIEYGIADKTYFTYKCNSCNKCFPSKFNGAVKNCTHCNTTNSAVFCSVANGVSTNDLNNIYNLFDLFLQYAICEGFGMPQVEAASCGLQIASVDYSAMTEIVESVDGVKIPVKRLFRELETGADRAYPDNDFTIKYIHDFFNVHSDSVKANKSKIIREKCNIKYNWDNVYNVWDECFSSISIDSKVPWSSKDIFKTNHADMSVPPNLSPKQFIEHICNHIINEPYLINTAHVQQLLRDVQNKIVSKTGMIKNFGYKDIIDGLEQHLNNKLVFEEMRNKEQQIEKENFLLCQSKR